MGICSSTVKTANLVIGEDGTLKQKAMPFSAYTIEGRHSGIPLGTVCVFDNKSKKKPISEAIAEMDLKAIGGKISGAMPRVGVVIDTNGIVRPIFDGNASVLDADDLECVGLIDAAANVYVATTSTGSTHVFKIIVDKATCYGVGKISAEHIAKGQLPVPKDESTQWNAANRTNIEATAVFKDSTGQDMIFWMGRGGDGKKYSWTYQAPFNYKTGNITEERLIQEGQLANTAATMGLKNWRNASAMQVHVESSKTEFYWVTAYDGEEDGHALNLWGNQLSEENKRAFKSAIMKATYPVIGIPTVEVISAYEGVKIEAIMLLESSGKVDSIVIGSDDEGLGSLIGSQPANATGGAVFVDLAYNSMLYNAIPKAKFGTSGLAPPGAFASTFV